MNFNDKETATLLACLRVAEISLATVNRMPQLDGYPTIYEDDIQALCEKINCTGASHVICHGNPFDGMTILGTFADGDTANEYAQDRLKLTDWWVMGLEDPRWGEGK